MIDYQLKTFYKTKKMCFFQFFSLCVRKKDVILQAQNGGTVAQLVEQRTENPRVTGSIPVGTTPLRSRKQFRLFLLHYLSNSTKKEAPPKGSASFVFGVFTHRCHS